jgi:hypothetical protein
MKGQNKKWYCIVMIVSGLNNFIFENNLFRQPEVKELIIEKLKEQVSSIISFQPAGKSWYP